ncbi:MAG: hypothetical protein PHV33_09805 [Elusimicrobiales bacterium]|nr:hypothetical protein [Elusimicrobiales bacterium]
MKKVFKMIGIISLAGLLLVVLLVGALVGSAAWARRKFIKETVAILSPVKSLAEIEKLDPVYRPDLIYTRRFANGEWAAARSLDEQDTEFGFEAALVYTSGGEFWISKNRHFCGYEGLSISMNEVKAETLAEFLSGLSAEHGFLKFR